MEFGVTRFAVACFRNRARQRFSGDSGSARFASPLRLAENCARTRLFDHLPGARLRRGSRV
jgi:hypothetical protein